MALDLKLKTSVVNNCKELVIQDVTGSYNSESNPGGWGVFNVTGNRLEYNLTLMLTVFHYIDGVQYSNVIDIIGLGYLEYPSEFNYSGFKLSINSHDISTAISEIPTTPEAYDPLQSTVEDAVYKLNTVVTLSGGDGTEIISNTHTFNSICNTEKKVNALIASIDLEGEDCDESSIDRALLAKSLLKNLKNIE